MPGEVLLQNSAQLMDVRKKYLPTLLPTASEQATIAALHGTGWERHGVGILNATLQAYVSTLITSEVLDQDGGTS
jgi:hypothetical protein